MNLHSKLAVTYETQIIDGKTGKVVKRNAPKRNLILDQGLDQVASNSFFDLTRKCVLGDSTNPVKRDSGSVTVSISGEVATASASFFESGDVDRLLKLDSGQEVYITGYTSATEVAVSGADDDSASEFTIWYVNETGHGNELVRTSNLGSDTDDNKSTWDGAKAEHKRTFIFPEETESRTYKEIGWSPASATGQNLFGRDLIPGGGDSISAGQRYKVVVKLQFEPGPLNQVTVSNVGGNGFDTSGNAILTGGESAFERKAFIGFTEDTPFSREVIKSGFMEPNGKDATVKRHVVFFTNDFTLPTDPNLSGDMLEGGFGENVDEQSYIQGSNEKVFSALLGVGTGNGDIFGFGFGNDNDSGFTVKFDSPQIKDSDHELTIKFKFSWGRTLIN